MDTLNPAIRITAAAQFYCGRDTDNKALKQALRQETGIDGRRLSRLSLLAALGAAALRNQAEISAGCAVYLATPFASPSLFDKMADNVLNCHAAMPFDFTANLHNAPAFYAAQVLGTSGASITLAAGRDCWHHAVTLAADSLFSDGRAAVGWCYEYQKGGSTQEGGLWLLLEYGTQGTPLPPLPDSAGTDRPSGQIAGTNYWQNVTDWLPENITGQNA